MNRKVHNETGCSSRKVVIESLVSGSVSSALTTIIYQPLELLKTRIQLDGSKDLKSPCKFFGRTTKSASKLVREYGILYLWRGTGASLLRSIPGVGLYYASLNVLQMNLSNQAHRPDSPSQALYFGITARSMISSLLLPATVVKVRYESGQFKYHSLSLALKDAYFINGWVGAAPTILRDSLFSGVYYMFYIKLKSLDLQSSGASSRPDNNEIETPKHSFNFLCGVVSGLVASIVTNPIDVLKTKIQVEEFGRNTTMKNVIMTILHSENGSLKFFDGLVPRCIRRTLIAATTWTFYEFLKDSLRKSKI